MTTGEESNFAISVLQFVLKRWQKIVQQDSGEERVTAKSRPMMSLIARAPSNLSSSTSERSEKRSHGNQNPWSAQAERGSNGATRCGQRPQNRVWLLSWTIYWKALSQARYSKWDDNKAWSSQEWKAETSMCDRTEEPVVTSWGKTREPQSSFFHEKTQHDVTAQSVVNEATPRDRTGQPVVIPHRGARPQQFIIGKRWKQNQNCQWNPDHSKTGWMIKCEKKQKRSSMNVTENEEKHSLIWGMFMSVTLESAVFMGKNYSDNWHSIKNTKGLTMKQMFDTSAKLVSEQDEISGVKTTDWENYSWKYLSLIGDEQIISLQRTMVSVFSDSVSCLGKIFENPESNDAWEQRLGWIKSSQN